MEELLKRGHHVVATMRNVADRNKDSASRLESLGAHVVEMDVTDDENVNSAVNKPVEQVTTDLHRRPRIIVGALVEIMRCCWELETIQAAFMPPNAEIRVIIAIRMNDP